MTVQEGLTEFIENLPELEVQSVVAKVKIQGAITEATNLLEFYNKGEIEEIVVQLYMAKLTDDLAKVVAADMIVEEARQNHIARMN
jgi:hypothetical protein